MARKPKIKRTDDKNAFVSDIRSEAVRYIRMYFNGRRRLDGSTVQVANVMDDKSINIVTRSGFDNRTFDFIHEFCLPTIKRNADYKNMTVPWTVHCLLKIIRELCSLGIPKEFQPGMILLYFRECRDIDIPPPPVL